MDGDHLCHSAVPSRTNEPKEEPEAAGVPVVMGISPENGQATPHSVPESSKAEQLNENEPKGESETAAGGPAVIGISPDCPWDECENGQATPPSVPAPSKTERLDEDSETTDEEDRLVMSSGKILLLVDNESKRCSSYGQKKYIMWLLVLLVCCTGIALITTRVRTNAATESEKLPPAETDPTLNTPLTSAPTATTTQVPTGAPTTAATRAPTVPPTRAPVTPPTLAPTPRVLQWKDFKGLLINVGSNSTQNDSRGNKWVSDDGGDVRSTGTIAVSNNCTGIIQHTAIDNNLFCTARVAQPQVKVLKIPRGSYVVTFHFTYSSNVRKEFEVTINNIRVYKELPKLPIEPFTAQSVDARVEVSQGFLQLDFLGLQFEPYITAIEVHKANSQFGASKTNLEYVPGLLTVKENGLILSEGLTARTIATTDEEVIYVNGSTSFEKFHEEPDAGATFVDTRPGNEGGWIYVSNSEVKPDGGVGAITFNKQGDVIEYRRLLSNTRDNCGGGRTPWNTWISCEETSDGQIYQVDPLGIREPERITMGETDSGEFESFAHDVRNEAAPRFFVTKDEDRGELRRFTPDVVNFTDPWTLLTGNGKLDYLVLTPSTDTEDSGTFVWSTSRRAGSDNAEEYYPNTEGIEVFEHELFFVSKELKRLVILDLDLQTYVFRTTKSGLLNGQPDQIHYVPSTEEQNAIYFTEDGGDYAGIHARGINGQFFTVLESHEWDDETTGMSFSPDFKHLYVAYQHSGLLFDVQRVDGHSFQATPLNIKYHNNLLSRSSRQAL